MRSIKLFMLFWLGFILPITFAAHAQAQLDLGQSSLSLDTAPDFLKEEDAYKLEATLDQGTLTIRWYQADTYYLYKDKYRVTVDGKDITNAANFDEGITKFDEFFGEVKTVYYNSNQISVILGERQGVSWLELDYQGCTDKGLCYPPNSRWIKIDFDANTAIESDTPPIVNDSGSLTDSGTGATNLTLTTAIVFALLGGIILNLMPCVFPVLSLKALSFSQQGNHRIEGIAYTLGCISFFTLLAVILISVRSSGQSLGWGFQLQQPIFIALLIWLFVMICLWLSGCLELSGRFQSAGQRLTQKQGAWGAYFTGALAAVVASPCTAPFMASALAFAVTQSSATALAVFVALGLGMALPILILSFIPKFSRILPKPGNWMTTFRQAMVFPMAITIVWLLWVFNNQTSSLATAALSLTMIATVFGGWLAIKGYRKAGWLIALLTLLATPLLSQQAHAPQKTPSFSIADIDIELENDKQVLLNVTADWCITCIANERSTLSGASFEQLLSDTNTSYIKADYTRPSKEIDQLLEEFNRVGIPLYVVYHPDNGEQVLPQILTPERLREALSQNGSTN